MMRLMRGKAAGPARRVKSDAAPMKRVMRGKAPGPTKYIVRTNSAGVFFGEIESRNGKEVAMVNARRIWFWAGAASLSQLAMEGTKLPDKCKFPCPVSHIILTEAIEIISCTPQAIASINAVPIWSA